MSKLSDKLAALHELVDWFDSAEMDIDQAMEKYESIKKLSREIETDLADLETKVSVVKAEVDAV